MRHYIILFFFLIIGMSFWTCKQKTTLDDSSRLLFEKYHQETLERLSIEWTLQGNKAAYPLLFTPDINENGSQYFFLSTFAKKIESLEITQPKQQILRDSLVNQMRLLIPKYKSSLKEMETDPSYYLIYPAIQSILNDESIEMNDRLLVISQKLEKSTAYFEQAKQNLQNPSLKPTLSAIQKLSKNYFFYRDTLSDLIEKSSLIDDEKQKCIQNTQLAALQIKDYLAFCKSALYNANSNSSLEQINASNY